ncbi:MAG: hypothetical protein FJX74_04395 [Armatimonadetes bacterium]|nr:hypothetical protein [Armatimonadota bacterium]
MTAHAAMALLATLTPSLLSAQRLALDKGVYRAGEPIRVVWSGLGSPDCRIAFYGADAPPGQHPPALWTEAAAPFGGVTFTTPLPAGDYTAHLVRGEAMEVLTEGVPFAVRPGAPGAGGIGHRLLVGPGVPGGQLADPQVFQEGSTYYITGTYSGTGGYIYSTADFRQVAATWMEIDTTPWPYPYQHIWAFEIYKHTDGTWHAYAFDYDRAGMYHFVPDPDPLTARFPVTRWKEKELLLPGDYDNKIVRDGDELYLLTAKGNNGHISIYCHRMLDPGRLDPEYEPHKILSEHGEGLESERRNAVGAMKIHECPSIARIPAPGGTKYVLSYSVGDYAIRDYKIGFAYSDVLIPPRGTEYTKATMADTLNVWGTGAGADEVVYIAQAQKPSWPNYHARHFSNPGSGDIVEHEGAYYLVHHATVPMQMEGMVGTPGWAGRLLWVTPIRFDFTGPIHTWARLGLPSPDPEQPVIYPSRTEYAPGEEIVLRYRNAGQSAWDWVGLFAVGAANATPLARTNVHGGDTGVGDVWAWERTAYGFGGSLRFRGPTEPGQYEARLFFCGASEVVAARCLVRVRATPNAPPTWQSEQLTAPTARAGRPYAHRLAGVARDDDGDPLTYSLTSSPTWLRVSKDGALSGTPPPGFTGANAFTIGVSDGQGDPVWTTLGIEVRPTP